MQQITEQLISYLKDLAQNLPLPLFSFVGSFVEELFGPIPSPLILMTVGSLASLRHYHWIYVLVLTAIASFGKTLSSFVYYIVADKAEDFVLRHFGKVMGVTHREIESLGKYFSGSRKDDVLIILSRAIPFFPTALVSLAAGFIKFNKKDYFRDTFIGYYIRCLMFVFLGYSGIRTYESFRQDTDRLSFFVPVTLSLLVGIILIWLYYYTRHHSIKSLFKKFSR